jgi:hypothetical protein
MSILLSITFGILFWYLIGILFMSLTNRLVVDNPETTQACGVTNKQVLLYSLLGLFTAGFYVGYLTIHLYKSSSLPIKSNKLKAWLEEDWYNE